jgi:hypothetical protein
MANTLFIKLMSDQLLTHHHVEKNSIYNYFLSLNIKVIIASSNDAQVCQMVLVVKNLFEFQFCN